VSESRFGYGLIEGFYGKPWSWEDRKACASFLATHGYTFYIYAPKTDVYLRERWHEEWPEEERRELKAFSDDVREMGLRLGIGLSPFEIYMDFNARARDSLRRKLLLVNELQPDILCILFDDMKGDKSKLAESQVRVFDFAAEISLSPSYIVCPSYYSFDPVLERLFGKMPEDYLGDLGELLDPAAGIFWTGTQVCSPGFSRSHLEEVTEVLKRKPFIWDNYPVNDSPRMSDFLHLRAFKDRSYQMADWTSGHAVNPMNQPYLSQIPMKTLAMSYESGVGYSPDSAFMDAAGSICGPDLGNCIIEDISLFQDRGLGALSAAERETLIGRYGSFTSPYAAEIVRWLKGEYAAR